MRLGWKFSGAAAATAATWKLNGSKWQGDCRLLPGKPELGTWLEFNGSAVGCAACKEHAKTQSDQFGKFGIQVTEKTGLTLCRLLRHSRSPSHQAAVARYVQQRGCQLDPNVVPPDADAFRIVLRETLKGSGGHVQGLAGVGSRKTVRQCSSALLEGVV